MGRRPPRYAVLLTSAALSTGLLLTGCGGDPKPSPPPTEEGTIAAGHPTTPPPTSPADPPTSADPTGTATATKSPTTTQSAPPHTTNKSGDGSPEEAGAPGVPQAARQHTNAGAKAFVRHFYAEFNKAMAQPKVGLLRPLSTDACGTCINYEKAAAESARKKQHLDGPSFRTQKMFVFPGKGGTTEVRVIHDLLARRLLDAQGDVVDERKTTTIEDRLTLAWTSDGWRVTSIRTVV